MSVFVTKALRKVWCSPEMDYQRIYRPGRLTSSGGVLRTLPILFSQVSMPTLRDRYHVFQLGNRSTTEMGIDYPIGDEWVNIVDIINSDQMQIDVYTDEGIFIPAKDTFIMRLDRGNLVIAIKDNGNMFTTRVADIYFRTYTNSWVGSIEASGLSERTFIYSVKVETLQQAADLLNVYVDYSRRAGKVRVTIDGVVSALTNVTAIPLGSHVDLFYDGAVNWVVTLPISQLKIFSSHLDSTEKYIIHPPKSLVGGEGILYHDDIDFYVITGNGTTRRGRLLHSNVAESQRMITHADYAIRVSHVTDLLNELGIPASQASIQMFIRKGKTARTLSYERHFIHELYKLPDADIIEILAEEKATIEYWTAACLENSYYTKLMRSGITQITEDDALKAFGYGGCTVEAMNTPFKLSDSVTNERPVGYRSDVIATITSRITGETDVKYMGPSLTVNGQDYPDGVIDLRLASVGHRRKVYHQEESFVLPNDLSFSAYRSAKDDGVASGEWVNVTGSTEYAYENGRFKWLIELPLNEVMVVPGDYSDLDSRTVDYIAETLFDLKDSHEVNGRHVPSAEIRVVVGTKLLTYGIDYHIANGKMFIVNLEAGRRTNVTVKISRTGCENDRPKVERGFIYGNTLSVNGVYELHDSSVKSVVSGGTLIASSEQVFAETGETNPLLVNGAPYEITYYRGPIKDVAWWKVEDLRADWDKTFGGLEDYLTSIKEEPVGTELVTIPNRHFVYSPFMHRIITDIHRGALEIGEGPHLDDRIVRLVVQYMYLLDYEPILSDTYDNRFIYVAPIASEYRIDITEAELYFIERLNALYLNSELSFTNFIGVDNG